MTKLEKIIYNLFRKWFRLVLKYENFVDRHEKIIFKIFLAALAGIVFIGYDMLAIMISLLYIMIYKT